MKFTCQVDINAPILKVIGLFDSTENLKEWQDGFVSFTPISGIPGQVGSKSKLIYKTGRQTIELTETITVKNLPEEMTRLYEHKHMVNTMSNQFSSIDENQTRWTAHVDYLKFNGFIPKLMAWFLPSMFRKQTQKWLDQFKEFVERTI